MNIKLRQPSSQPSLLHALAEFRHHLRSFLQFSEQMAQDHGLRPQQHQLLLQIAGLSSEHTATINFLAERLGLRQNSVVELADRSVAEGLVRRTEDAADRRRVVLSLTGKGRRVLDALSDSHARELDEFGPQLIRALERIKATRTEQGNRKATQSQSSLRAKPSKRISSARTGAHASKPVRISKSRRSR